jgi:hypothetical protein
MRIANPALSKKLSPTDPIASSEPLSLILCQLREVFTSADKKCCQYSGYCFQAVTGSVCSSIPRKKGKARTAGGKEKNYEGYFAHRRLLNLQFIRGTGLTLDISGRNPEGKWIKRLKS